jgi:hypothetical protein
MALWKEQPNKPNKPVFRSQWTGGSFVIYDAATDAEVFRIDATDGNCQLADAKLGQTEITGQFFLPSGELLASADELNTAGIITQYDRLAVGALSGAAAADDIVFVWKNPESVPVIVYRVVVDVTKAGATATAVLDIGSAADAVTGSDDLIDGVDANAVATYCNYEDEGTNGKRKQIIPVDEYVTGQIKVDKAEDLEGNVYIFYLLTS